MNSELGYLRVETLIRKLADHEA